MEELVLLIAFIGAFVSTIAGFGSATILIPFISLIIDIKSAIVLAAIFHFANNVSKLGLMSRSVNSKLFVVYGLPSVVTALFGAWMFGRADTALIGITFSIFLIIFSIYSLYRPSFHIPEKDSLLAAGGLLSGFTSGLIGVGGAIRSMFLISTFLKKEAYIATAASIAILVDISRVSIYLYQGSLFQKYIVWVAPLVIMAFAGAFFGRKAEIHERRIRAESGAHSTIIDGNQDVVCFQSLRREIKHRFHM